MSQTPDDEPVNANAGGLLGGDTALVGGTGATVVGGAGTVVVGPHSWLPIVLQFQHGISSVQTGTVVGGTVVGGTVVVTGGNVVVVSGGRVVVVSGTVVVVSGTVVVVTTSVVVVGGSVVVVGASVVVVVASVVVVVASVVVVVSGGKQSSGRLSRVTEECSPVNQSTLTVNGAANVGVSYSTFFTFPKLPPFPDESE